MERKLIGFAAGWTETPKREARVVAINWKKTCSDNKRKSSLLHATREKRVLISRENLAAPDKRERCCTPQEEKLLRLSRGKLVGRGNMQSCCTHRRKTSAACVDHTRRRTQAQAAREIFLQRRSAN